MELIIKQDSFDLDRIDFKFGKKCIKIIYNLGTIKMIGLTFKLSSKEINETDDFIYINIKDTEDYKIVHMIDEYFKNKFKEYSSSIINNIIKVKKHNHYKNNDIFITFNNLKKINDKLKVQIFTI